MSTDLEWVAYPWFPPSYLDPHAPLPPPLEDSLAVVRTLRTVESTFSCSCADTHQGPYTMEILERLWRDIVRAAPALESVVLDSLYEDAAASARVADADESRRSRELAALETKSACTTALRYRGFLFEDTRLPAEVVARLHASIDTGSDADLNADRAAAAAALHPPVAEDIGSNSKEGVETRVYRLQRPLSHPTVVHLGLLAFHVYGIVYSARVLTPPASVAEAARFCFEDFDDWNDHGPDSVPGSGSGSGQARVWLSPRLARVPFSDASLPDVWMLLVALAYCAPTLFLHPLRPCLDALRQRVFTLCSRPLRPTDLLCTDTFHATGSGPGSGPGPSTGAGAGASVTETASLPLTTGAARGSVGSESETGPVVNVAFRAYVYALFMELYATFYADDHVMSLSRPSPSMAIPESVLERSRDRVTQWCRCSVVSSLTADETVARLRAALQTFLPAGSACLYALQHGQNTLDTKDVAMLRRHRSVVSADLVQRVIVEADPTLFAEAMTLATCLPIVTFTPLPGSVSRPFAAFTFLVGAERGVLNVTRTFSIAPYIVDSRSLPTELTHTESGTESGAESDAEVDVGEGEDAPFMVGLSGGTWTVVVRESERESAFGSGTDTVDDHGYAHGRRLVVHGPYERVVDAFIVWLKTCRAARRLSSLILGEDDHADREPCTFRAVEHDADLFMLA